MSKSALKIDTLALAKELEEVGIPDDQAETQILVYVKLVDMIIEDTLATKQDIQALDKKIDSVEVKLDKKIDALDKKIDGVEARLDRKIEGLDTKITALASSIDNKLERLSLNLTVRLGTLMASSVFLVLALEKLIK